MRNVLVDIKRRFWETDQGLSLLLVVLVVNVFILPTIVQPGVVSRALFDVFFSLLILTGIAATRTGRVARAVMMTVAVLALAIRGVYWVFPSVVLDSGAVASGIASTGLLAVVVLAQVAREGPVTVHRILGAVAAYLLLGFTWGQAYCLVALNAPGAFTGMEDLGNNPLRLVYFSFVTLTTIGYGDVTPVHPVARTLAILEGLTGQLYPAILLARLVSLEVAHREKK
jgi:hypothetical protein